jgi:hypothetical protein
MATKKITYSTELMTNFRQAQAISPQRKFEAMHTKDGYSLLFSIGNDDIFYLTQQTPGETTGWKQLDLSSKLGARHGGKPIKAKDFAVSQNHQSGKLDMVLVITVEGKDYLYTSLDNEAKLNAIQSITIPWNNMPYDDPRHANITVSVENLYIAETEEDQYIVVDISRKTFAQPSNFLERYYIDAAKNTGRFWNNMVTGGDLHPENLCSVMGRNADGMVDGIYTLGSINGKQELLYAPVYNFFDADAPPTIIRLQAPANATALATADIGNDITDLFVIADDSLYYYPADGQKDEGVGDLVQTNELFKGTKKMFAFATKDKFVVWGLNRANQVFYTSCLRKNVLHNKFWTYPVPILKGVNQVSPYLNIKDTSNNFFAVSSNKLKKAVQSPQTSIWDFEEVSLPTPANTKAKQFSSYTTRVVLTDGDDQLLKDQTLYLSSISRTPVFVNNLYYVLSADPIAVETDSSGSITIVEELEDVAGARLTVTDKQGLSVVINPMEKAFNKVATLNSADKLKEAEIVDPKTGKSTNLVSGSTKQEDLEAVAKANENIAKAYKKVDSNLLRSTKPLLLTMTKGNTVHLKGFGDVILAELGDIVSWLESGVKHIVHLVQDLATGFWSFVVEIAGKVYQGIMNCVEKVVAAVRWLYDAIKTAIEDLLKYLSFLFEWKDITRTKEVLKNIIKLYARKQVDQIGDSKKRLNTEMDKLKRNLNEWAGIKDYKGLGAVATATAASQSKPDEQTAPGGLISSHFQSNGGNTQELSKAPKAIMASNDIADKLFEAMKNSSKELDKFMDQFEQLAKDIPSLSLEDILKRIVGIIAGAILEGAKAVMNALFDILSAMAEAALAILDEPVYIPVVSDILEFFGVPKLSMLDLMCWMAAVPLTIGHKAIHGSAPFKDNEQTNFLINAKKFDDLVEAFRKPPKTLLQGNPGEGLVAVEIAGHPGKVFYVDQSSLQQAPIKSDGLIKMDDGLAKIVYVSGHSAACVFQIISAFVSGVEAMEPPGSQSKWGKWAAVFGIVTAASGGGANFLIPKLPIKDEAFHWTSTATTGVTVLSKLIFSGPGQGIVAKVPGLKWLKVGDNRSVGSVVNCVLIIPALVCTVMHFIELSKEPDSTDKTAAILDETSNVTSYVSRLSYMVAVNSAGPVKVAGVVLMTVANVCTAGLHAAGAVVVSKGL